MISIYTTVAQHPRGLDLHIRNLKWAFSNFEHKIFVQTFSRYNFNQREGVTFLLSDADPQAYHSFYTDLEVDHGDVVAFVQQDNLFTQKVDPIIQMCLQGPIVTWDQSSYHAIYAQPGQKIYPRIGEISTFMRREFIQEARNLGLSLSERGNMFGPQGRMYRHFYPLLKNFLINAEPWLASPDCYQNLADYCLQEKKDTFFEVFLYSFCMGRPVKLLRPDMMVHMQNPEMFHREEPSTYASAENLLRVKNRDRRNIKRYIPAVALMFLLSGVYETTCAVSEALKRGDKRFIEDFKYLEVHAALWMSADQRARLKWAATQIET